MATSAMATVPPPPGGPTPDPPKAGADASPAPAATSPSVEEGSRLVIQIVQALRKLGQQVPGAQPAIMKINDAMREVQMKVMAAGKPTEPAAPPVPPS
jgi:hypothetical protein